MEEMREKVLYLRDVEHLSFRQIAEKMKISRRRVSCLYHGRGRGQQRPFILDPYHSLIAHWFHEYPTLRADQVYLWLQQRGVTVSYPTVARYTQKLRTKKQPVYHHLHFLPGEEAQVDWLFINHPKLGKLACFVCILSYSRYLFAHVFPRSSFEFFIEGHIMTFSAFNGIPHSMRYDNTRSVVIQLKPEIRYNPRFLEFCRHYGIQIRLCNPYRGNEKGRVERVIRTLKESFFAIATYASYETLNDALHRWVKHKNHSLHRSTEKTPIDLFKEEKLKVLPAISWNNVSIYPPVTTTKTAMMIFDTNAYSVPEYLVGKSLSIHATPNEVRIYDKHKKVASHVRSFTRHQQIINPLHRQYTTLSQKAKLHRIYDVIKNMHPTLRDFLLRNHACGENPYTTAYEIFHILKKESRTLVVGIAQQCLQKKSPRLHTFLSSFNLTPYHTTEQVLPHKTELLHISYNPRPLEVYDDEYHHS